MPGKDETVPEWRFGEAGKLEYYLCEPKYACGTYSNRARRPPELNFDRFWTELELSKECQIFKFLLGFPDFSECGGRMKTCLDGVPARLET